MTVTTDRPTAAPALSVRPRRLLRRWVFWVALGVVAVLVAIVVGMVQAAGRLSSTPLDPTSPGPKGAMALVQVLRQQGVSVEIVHSYRAALAATDSETTLVFHDPYGFLDASAAERLRNSSTHVVAIEPGFYQLGELAPELTNGFVDDETTAEPECSLPDARRAGAITTTGTAYAATDDPRSATFCYPTADGDTYSLVRIIDSRGVLDVLGATAALSNAAIAENGNAALALSLLGSRDRLVWYEPGYDDLEEAPADSIGTLSPQWVVPVMLLGVAVFLAAAVWRGRRFGPLVAETLPVVVRSTETMEGRARLYERAGARLRALDALRMGVITRSAALLGLPRTSTVEEVVRASAAMLGWPVDRVAAILVAAVPGREAELTRHAVALDDFEARLGSAVRGDAVRQDGPGASTTTTEGADG